jgi:predicted phage tail protein
MQTVRLVGNIAQFGEVWETSCNNVRDIFKLIDCQTSGFRKYLMEADKAGVAYEIRKGKDILQNPEDLLLKTVDDEEIVIVEVPDGAKAGLKIIAGIILTVVGFATGQTWLISIGANLIVGGITELLAPGPETEDADDPSYLFNGPVNNIRQGLPVPVLYGELIVGGGAISAYYSSAPIVIRGDTVEGNASTTSAGNVAINFNSGEGSTAPTTENRGLNSYSLSTDSILTGQPLVNDTKFNVSRRG